MSQFGKDKDDNEITLLEILENDERSIEDEIDLKLKTKKLFQKMKEVLMDIFQRHKMKLQKYLESVVAMFHALKQKL